MISLSFGSEDPPEVSAFWGQVTEPARTIAGYDPDGTVTASATTFSFSMTAPGGGAVPTAGISMVAVLPTHRRQGLLTGLMKHQLYGLHEAGGESVAVLTASEPAIYGRFGYGLGSWKSSVEVTRSASALRDPSYGAGLRLKFADPALTLDKCGALYAELLPTRPGLIARSGAWATRQVTDPVANRGGASPLRCVLVEDGSGLRGYAYFSTTPSWGPAGADGTANVREVLARDPEAYAALWRFLLDLDLMSTVRAGNLPVDDALFALLADPRRARIRTADGLYVRLVDVDRALASRTYATSVDVVVDVVDGFCPWNAGRWRLSGDDKSATCERTEDPADIRLDIRELGSLYLGGTTALQLAAAGLVEELRPGAVAHTSQAFAHDPAPWMSFSF